MNTFVVLLVVLLMIGVVSLAIAAVLLYALGELTNIEGEASRKQE